MICNGNHSSASRLSVRAASELALVIVEPLDGGVRLVNVVHEVELLAEDLSADGAAVAVLAAGRKVAQPEVPPHVALVPVPTERRQSSNHWRKVWCESGYYASKIVPSKTLRDYL